MNLIKSCVSVLLVLLLKSTVYSQTLLNGSFEITSAPVGCNYNLSNATFNGWMTNVLAFGGGEETDIIMDGCYVTGLPDGLRSISIAHVPEDEVSMAIDAPLVTGVSYTLSMWALGETTFVPSGNFQIGASTSATSFGTLIYTGTPTVMAWGNHTFTFIAPNDATHITVRNAPGGAYWNHLDHFEFIVPLDDLDMDNTNVTCFGACDGTAEVIPGVDPPYSYVWDAAAGGALTADVAGLCPGTYSVTVTNGSGLVEVLDVTITEPPLLTIAEVVSTDLICNGDGDGVITVIGAGGVPTYEYSIDGGAYAAPGSFTGLDGGTFTLSVRDDNGCTADMDITLTEPTAIVVDESATGEICEGDCMGTIDLTSVGGTGVLSYSIDGCVTSSPIGAFTDLCDGTYNICVEDENGCQYTSTLVVNPGTPLTDATITPFGPLCVDDPAVVIDAIDIGTLTGTGVSGGVFNPAIAGAGAHVITNTILGGCGGVDTYTVTVHPTPTVTFVSDIQDGCQPVEVTFTNTGTIGTSCQWTFGDGGISTSCGITAHNYLVPGEFDVSLIITDANGCSGSITYADYIEVFENPVANFTYNPSNITTLNTQVNFIDASASEDNWDWQFDALGNSNIENPTFTFPEVAGVYEITLIAYTVNGCSDTITKIINVYEEQLFYIPNTFTPDGDTYNELFRPYFRGIDPYDFHMTIYNRWGEIVFESYDATGGWNGAYGGLIVADGVYIWHIVTSEIATDKKLEYHGHVTVLR
jgi:gliding motility-associated-like protein